MGMGSGSYRRLVEQRPCSLPKIGNGTASCSRPHGLSPVVLAEVVVAVEFDQAFEHGAVAAELVASFHVGEKRGRRTNLSFDLTRFDLDLELLCILD